MLKQGRNNGVKPNPLLTDNKTRKSAYIFFAALYFIQSVGDPTSGTRLSTGPFAPQELGRIARVSRGVNGASPCFHTIQPSSRALSLASFQASARNSDRLIEVRLSSLSAMRLAIS